VQICAFDRFDARMPSPAHRSSSRFIPTRSPYSTQVKLGTSGTARMPCGGGRMARGMGWSKGQYSTFTATFTITRLPRKGTSGALSPSSRNGMRGLGVGMRRAPA
jgi:hypothetical protein